MKDQCLALLGLVVGFGISGAFILGPCDVRGNEGFFCQCSKVFGLAVEGFALGSMFECAGDGSWSVFWFVSLV